MIHGESAYYPSHGNPVPVSVAAAGSGQSTAALLTNGVLNLVTGADGTKGVQLPVAAAGDVCRVYSATATNAVPVYAQTGGQINSGTANAAFSCSAQTPYLFECIDGTSWIAK